MSSCDVEVCSGVTHRNSAASTTMSAAPCVSAIPLSCPFSASSDAAGSVCEASNSSTAANNGVNIASELSSRRRRGHECCSVRQHTLESKVQWRCNWTPPLAQWCPCRLPHLWQSRKLYCFHLVGCGAILGLGSVPQMPCRVSKLRGQL